MVALDAVRVSNAKLRQLPPGLVAVFLGGTSGIAESTLKQFYRQTIMPRVYIVGRSQDAADRILSELKAIQPEAEAFFIRKDLSLLRNVDEVCNEIKAKETKLNLLFMTTGTMSLKGRDETSEGLDKKLTTNYYARLRSTQQLLPLLEAASPQLSRVVSVLAPGEESLTSFHLDDLDLKNKFSLRTAACHTITMTDFAFEEMAKKHPSTSFVHASPGIVKTGFNKSAGAVMKVATNAAYLLLAPWRVNIEESGERHLYAATSATYPAQSGKEVGADLGTEKIKKGSNGEVGSGAYLIGWDGEFRANEKVLKELRSNGAGSRIWQHTVHIFEDVAK